MLTAHKQDNPATTSSMPNDNVRIFPSDYGISSCCYIADELLF